MEKRASSDVRNKLTNIKLVSAVKTGIDLEEFQKDFMNLREWRIQWDTTCKANKCKAIYRVKCSPHFTHKMIGCEQTQDHLSLAM